MPHSANDVGLAVDLDLFTARRQGVKMHCALVFGGTDVNAVIDGDEHFSFSRRGMMIKMTE